MGNENSSNTEVSLLEKILVNWSTPLEGLLLLPLTKSGVKVSPKLQPYFDKYGVFKAIWESKVTDYQRLLNYTSDDGDAPKKILKLYNETPCGYVMQLTYKALR